MFPGFPRATVVVDNVSLSVRRGETLAVVGESRSGKTMTFLSALGLVPWPGYVAQGKVLLDGVDLLRLGSDALRRKRGAEIAMAFQDPLTALNPVFSIGDQITEVLRAHQRLNRTKARVRAIELLEEGARARTRSPSTYRRLSRISSRWHAATRPDRHGHSAATTGAGRRRTDYSARCDGAAQVLELLRELKRRDGMGLVLITHDLGLVAAMPIRSRCSMPAALWSRGRSSLCSGIRATRTPCPFSAASLTSTRPPAPI